ncbi:Uncharacterized protein, coenzyme F420 biosynthesis associated [Rubrobacter radiotolerans]|nr:Uncharacterized protein, coenzyme F420 biosynthesis associated [Rubrobacter radiotolerans]
MQNREAGPRGNSRDGMVHWGAARSVAVAVAARSERRPSGSFDYASATQRAMGPLSDFTGIELASDPATERRIVVSDRAGWIDFNIEGFGVLMEPVLQRAARGASDITRLFSGATLTAQMGFLLGFLSARVLGQYDTGPLLPKETGAQKVGEPGKVFFLDGNIASAASRLRISEDGLRLWIVLHEMTHALQFEGFPWLRDHLGRLMGDLLSPLSEKLGLSETVRRLTSNYRTGGRSIELLMTREQRASFEKVQATMSVIEGYSDYVMDRVGRRTVPGYAEITRRLAASRANRPALDTAIFRLTGLDAKLEQYRLGESFCTAVASRQGMEGLNRVWDGPENLPTLEEVRDPGLWMLRMERASEAHGPLSGT